LAVNDPDVAKMLEARAKAAGPDGQLFPHVSDKSLLDYVHTFGGFKTKDFRTRLGTKLAQTMVDGMEAPTDEKSYKKQVLAVAKHVSSHLGNTPAIALAAYISPVVWGKWSSAMESKHNKPQEEAASVKDTKLPDAHFGVVGKPVDWRKKPLHDSKDDDEAGPIAKSTRMLIGFNPYGKPTEVKK
jgi:hypothetical protein